MDFFTLFMENFRIDLIQKEKCIKISAGGEKCGPKHLSVCTGKELQLKYKDD